ncbi:PapD-like protein [Kalaharituber pfeilii]|nr:PapD-like protein [Kalaharituber pfeilii]
MIALEPTELAFRRPFTQEVTQTLTIKNTHYEPIAFKVKTTAPKQYCVRPNSGRIEAGQSVPVKVLLQAMKEDPAPDFKCRDKFLVQSVAITADKEAQSTTDIWAYVDKNDKGSIQERKIRVAFLPEDGATNGMSEKISSRPPSYQESASLARTTPTGRPESRPDDSIRADAPSHASTPASSPPNNDLAAQLAEARQQIVKLRRQLAEQQGEGLRQRITASSNETEKTISGAMSTPTSLQPGAPEGVPVKIVAALCLVSFLLALLF